MKQYIKYICMVLFRALLKVFYLFPIDKRMFFFDCNAGNLYGCNLKPIFEELYKQNTGNKYIWVLNNKETLPDIYKSNVTVVRSNSFLFVYYFLRSKYIFTNGGFTSFIPKRKRQVFINTWHGGGSYKSIDPSKQASQSVYFTKATEISSAEVDYFVSSSEGFSNAIKEDLKITPDKFLNIGMPRNDIFFDKEESLNAQSDVRLQLGIDESYGIVLYAPTYRGEANNPYNDASSIIDIPAVLDCLEKRFGKPFKFLLREHPPIKPAYIDNSIDVTAFPDIQPLLCAADVLITDYSSCMWDFSLTKKPGFLFTPDLDKYVSERGVKLSIDEWPFPYAKTSAELCNIIECFDPEKAAEKIKKHHNLLHSYETGTATKTLIKSILNQK